MCVLKFKVPYVDTFEMLKTLDISFGWERPPVVGEPYIEDSGSQLENPESIDCNPDNEDTSA